METRIFHSLPKRISQEEENLNNWGNRSARTSCDRKGDVRIFSKAEEKARNGGTQMGGGRGTYRAKFLSAKESGVASLCEIFRKELMKQNKKRIGV